MNRIQMLLLVSASGLALGALGQSQYRAVPAVPGVVISRPQDTTFAPATIALGEKIFHGRAAGGLCFSCHGASAKGTKGLAPNLTDATWLHGDGSFLFLVTTIEQGIPKPKEAGAPMPPKGGARLSTEQVHAVAAYVYSLRRTK